MLTKEQLEQLRPLTEDPKFGKLLQASIVTWKRCKPVCAIMGITFDLRSGKFEKRAKANGCCLLGASICNRKAKFDSCTKEINTKFNISDDEHYALMAGFDNWSDCRNTDAYKFAKKVREILNPEKGICD